MTSSRSDFEEGSSSSGGLDPLDWRPRGYLHLPGLLSSGLVAELGDALLQAFPGAQADGPYGLLKHNLRTLVPAFAAAFEASGWVEKILEVTGDDALLLFQDHLIWKTPGTTSPVHWHQDYAYWPLDRPAGWTLWIALDDADEENGCLHYLPASQSGGECAPTDFVEASGNALPSSLPHLDILKAEAGKVVVPVKAGDGLLHHPLIWHGSPPNLSRRPRRAWSLSWIVPGTRWDPEHAPHVYQYTLQPVPGSEVAGDAFPRFTARSSSSQ